MKENKTKPEFDLSKADLIRLTAKELDLTKKEVKRVFDCMEKIQLDYIYEGYSVIKGLNGHFTIQEKKGYIHRASIDKVEKIIPDRKRVVFIPNSKIKRVNKVYKILGKDD